jgi:V/A-type H+/Na+-transporting ATPase subunit K
MGWIGIYSPVALAAVGSSIGCTTAGKAACGAILEVDGGYGRYIGLSVLPSSIVICGIVIMFSLNRPVNPATSPGLLGVGLLVAVALIDRTDTKQPDAAKIA